MVRLEVTWSEKLAQYLTKITPILLGLGLLGLFIEFKTPGFGIFGIAGISLLGIVFFGQYAAGLSGHEPLLIFLIGLILVIVDIFFFPGTMILALTGIVTMLGALVWSMIDMWPSEPIDFSGDMLFRPLASVMTGVLIAALIFIAILRFLPGSGPWGGMVLHSAVRGEPDGIRSINNRDAELVGQKGIAKTSLFPSGQVEIAGRRYEAALPVGFAEAGAEVIVTGCGEFGLTVEVVS